MERVAVADRQAVLTAAAVNGVKDFQSPDVDEAIERWETWLAHDPEDPAYRQPTMAERVARFEEQVAAMEEVA